MNKTCAQCGRRSSIKKGKCPNCECKYFVVDGNEAVDRIRELEAALRDCMGWLPTHRSELARDEYENAYRLIATPDSEPAEGTDLQWARTSDGRIFVGYNPRSEEGGFHVVSWAPDWINLGAITQRLDDTAPDSEPAEGEGGEDVPETIVLSKRDLRPKRYGWAPGYYANTCQICGKHFVGDKWAWNCAPCAYADDTPPQRRDAGDILREKLSDPKAMQRVTERAAERQDAMLERRDALEAFDWVDVRERMPVRGELVLVTYKSSSNKRSVEPARWTGSFWVFPDSRLKKRSDRVTGWMPQPRPYVREVEDRRRALSAGVPEGWKLVPVEPTHAMLVDGAKAIRDFYSERPEYPRTRAMWRAMLAAAPQPQEGESDE